MSPELSVLVVVAKRTGSARILTALNTYNMIDSGWSFGLGHFINLFKNETTKYLNKVCSKNKPKIILVNTIYYLDEKKGDSWADNTLNILGYNDNPEKLQLCIRKIFEYATSQIKIDGVKVIPVPMYEILNGKEFHIEWRSLRLNIFERTGLCPAGAAG